ncbi:prepilin-type N-terminal cleavage/methylation domain-containing protein [Alistipes sp. OttesenSCG-928-B03]|nr:prepilin-type N-terminal cleavage/methylation domain-containing protein [Alistipes sp. OttesenSCG-928-B03]
MNFCKLFADFSCIELLVVLIIVGILVLIAGDFSRCEFSLV